VQTGRVPERPLTRDRVAELAESLRKLLFAIAAEQEPRAVGVHLVQAARALEPLSRPRPAVEPAEIPEVSEIRVNPGPVQVIKMEAHRPYGPPKPDEVHLIAVLRPAPAKEISWWWHRRLHDRVRGVYGFGGGGGPDELWVQADVPLDRLEVTARLFLNEVAEANRVFPDCYESDLRERDRHQAEETARQQDDLTEKQAILDRVMDEYRSTEPPGG
jgi:hypothetical protein